MKAYFFNPFLLLFLLLSCKQNTENQKNNTNQPEKSSLQYAKHLEIITFTDYQKVIVKNPISEQEMTYFLVDKNKEIPTHLKRATIIRTPIEKIVVTSTTHIAMLELLGVENALFGFPQTHFVSSEKTRQRIDIGLVKELGNVQQLNTEILLTLQPNLIMSFEITGSNKTLQDLEKKGFTILVNSDWKEETPLGRAEWIKLYGALFSKSSEAEIIFNEIEQNYLNAKAIAKKATDIPTVFSGSVFNDVWNLPAGKSFEAQLFKDANMHYLWSDTDGTGSLSLSIEAVLNKAKEADIWIATGFYTSKSELNQSHNLYQHFKPFKNNRLYSYGHLRGKTGGYLYFETAPTRPDLVLKDLIKIAHPELMRHYEFTFYKQLKQ